ncbi:glutathione S-transferase family protein [Roseibium sp.]|uniref:glutathione S-transferase family protein n=1 Tax=Roseibium sp. TaxID=1936156 RepID=UPI003BAA59D0
MIELFGADYSVYVRSVRLALEEKGLDYTMSPIDVFAPEGVSEDYLSLNPFGKIPTFRHGDFVLFETDAILRYLDEAFDGPRLQPSVPRDRAVMNQILSILDAYAYRTCVWEIYVERVEKTRGGAAADEVRIASALGEARKIVGTLETLIASEPFMLGSDICLADCHAAPMLHLLEQAEEGAMLLKRAPKLARWLEMMRARQSFQKTAPAPHTK